MITMDDPMLNFRNAVLDSKSKSFCGAKWGNSTLWLNSGETSSCGKEERIKSFSVDNRVKANVKSA